MSLQLVHISPEATFLIIEVPVVAGKENPVIKTLWEQQHPGRRTRDAAWRFRDGIPQI
jgi:carbonic anhydrase